MLTATEHQWIAHAMQVLEQDDISEMAALKTYRTIGQMFETAATRIELKLIDKVENRLYNTNTEQRSEHA